MAPLRKDIELLRCDFRAAASHCAAQRLCFPFPDVQSSRIVPLASAPAGCAVPYSTTRDHCGALKGFSRNISESARDIPAYSSQDFAAPETLPARLTTQLTGTAQRSQVERLVRWQVNAAYASRLASVTRVRSIARTSYGGLDRRFVAVCLEFLPREEEGTRWQTGTMA